MSTVRFGPLALVTVLAMSVYACTDETTDPTPTSSRPDETTTVPGEEYSLAYSYSPGDILEYDLDLSQHLVLSTEGSASAVAEEEIPGRADVTVDATGVFTFTVSDGPEDGTFAVDIEGTFDDARVEGTADGEPVDEASDLDQLGVIAPVSTTVIVDERGRIVEDTSSPSDPLGMGGSPLAGLAGDLSRLVGPVLPAEEVRVGESWTETHLAQMMGSEPVDTTVTATITGTEQIDGRETVVIESSAETGESEVDLSEFFAGFMGAFADPQSGTTPDSMQDLMADLVFRIHIDPSTSTSTTWFDPEEGVAVRSTTEGPTSLQMEASLPNQDSGELQSFSMNLDVDQSMEYRLR